MKKKIFVTVLVLSILANLFFIWKMLSWDKTFEPTEEERVILGEMIVKTTASKDYKRLAKKEEVIAVLPGVQKMKGEAFPHSLEVYVYTNKATYIFGCTDDQCHDIEYVGGMYSRYSDENPHLPLQQ